MPSITALAESAAKILLIGKNGAGKTGSLAALVAEGYNVRIIDSDKGVKTLHSLLTDPKYPYAALIKKRNIDLSTAVRFIPIDTSMKLRNVNRTVNGRTVGETLLAPADAKAWLRIVDALDNWKDDDLTLGSVSTWGPKDVLVLDSFSTIAKCAYYFNQSLNGRLGARDEGFDYQRDIGGAQSQLTRLLELLHGSNVPCNVIVISHITWVDDSQGVASRPRTADDKGNIVMSSPDGYPSAIGRALSPQMGKYFNDIYVSRQTGSGLNVSRTISTVPQEGVLAKNSVYLEREYPVSYGLASIFATIQGAPAPSELIEACSPRKIAPAPVRPTSPTAA